MKKYAVVHKREYGEGATTRRAYQDTLDQYGQGRTKLADVRSARKSELKRAKVSPMNGENVSWRARTEYSVVVIVEVTA